ncbi:MAG: AAA family ATPase [Tepidisphaeraceae bacterium]
MLGVLLLCVVVAAAYLLLTPKTYTAVARVQVRPFGDLPKDTVEALLAAQPNVVRSAEVLRPLDSTPELSAIPTLSRQKDPVRYLQSRLRVETKGGILTIGLSGATPGEVERTVDLVVDAYRAYQRDTNQTHAQELLDQVNADRKAIEPRLLEVRGKLNELLKQDAMLRLDPAQSPAAQKAATLADALSKAQLETIDLKTAYESLRTRGGELFAKATEDDLNRALSGEVTADSDVATQDELRMLEQKLIDLRRTYLPNHPSVMRVNDRIKQLKLMQLATARDRWKAAERKQGLLEQELGDAQKQAASSSARAGEFASLNAELKRLEARSMELDRRRDDAMSSAADGVVRVDRVHSATVTDADYPPTPRTDATGLLTTISFGALAGLLLGVTGALLAEWRSTGTVRHAMPGANVATLRPRAEKLGLPILASVAPVKEPGGTVALAWAGQIDPQSKMARATRVIRRAVEVQGQLPATLVFTSPAHGDGKTSVACNLAAAIATEGRKVLLVDLSFDAPKLRDIYSIEAKEGIADVLGGSAEPASVVRSTSVPKLDVLTTGNVVSEPAVMLNDHRFGELISTLTAAYDHLILDCDPTSAGDAARIVASLADATVLVSRANRTGAARSIATARDSLMTLGAHVIGLVLTDDARSAGPAEASDELNVAMGSDDASGFFRPDTTSGGTSARSSSDEPRRS